MNETEEQRTEEPKEYTLEIVKGNKPRKTYVREIPIIWEGKSSKVVIKKLTYGERAGYVEKFLNIQLQGQVENVNVSIAQMQIQAIVMATHEAPFPLNEDYVTYELPGDVGEKIYKEIEQFNKLNPGQEKN